MGNFAAQHYKIHSVKKVENQNRIYALFQRERVNFEKDKTADKSEIDESN